jgi:hypothetical protein
VEFIDLSGVNAVSSVNSQFFVSVGYIEQTL